MPYYRITYESDTLEGLKAIQGSFPSHGVSGTDESTSPVPPPPPQDIENLDEFSGIVPAPPPGAETVATLDETNFYPPPPVTDSAILGMSSEGEILPPPIAELQDPEGHESQPAEGSGPLQQPTPKSPKAPRK